MFRTKSPRSVAEGSISAQCKPPQLSPHISEMAFEKRAASSSTLQTVLSTVIRIAFEFWMTLQAAYDMGSSQTVQTSAASTV